MNKERHLVLGATGALGSALVRQLLNEPKNKTVLALVRDPERLLRLTPKKQPLVLIGNATDPDTMRKALFGCQVVYLCLNAPLYLWESVMPAVMKNVIDGASEAGARVIFPGNVYVYGHVKENPVSEDTQALPHTRKGQVRLKMEEALLTAQQEGRLSGAILRLPDFYGPNVTNRLMLSIFQHAVRKKPMVWYGKLDVPHEFVFINDAAKAMILLAEASKERMDGQTYHLPGPRPITPREWLTMVAHLADRPPNFRAVSRRMFRFLSLFSTEAREFSELFYLNEEELCLSGRKFEAAFGQRPATSYEEGIQQTLAWFREAGEWLYRR